MCSPAKFQEMDGEISSLEERVTSLEAEVGELRRDTNNGFNSVNSNIETLSQQITNMDKRIIEEKQRWGETLRGIVKWTVRAILAVVTYAAGVNLTKDLLPGIFN